MQIAEIYVSQRTLRRVAQIPAMVDTLEIGGCLPRITLSRSRDGSIQVDNGHHRLTAIWLSGRTELEADEYLLFEKEQWRPRFGRIPDLMARCGITARW
jgi:hypothetical protein